MWLIGLAVIFTLDLLATPLAAEAQSAGKVQRIGYLSLHRAEGDKTWVAAFRQGLRELGYVEDQNVVIEQRHAAGRSDRLPELASELVLEAFDQYWRKSPNVKRLVLKAIPEASGRGEVDIAYAIRGALAEELRRTPGLTLKPNEPNVGQATHWVYFTEQWDPKSPWHDRRVRLAANYAIDRQAINQADALGYARITGSIIPSRFEFYWQPPGYTYDPARAKQLLAEAGYPNGFDAAKRREAILHRLQQLIHEKVVVAPIYLNAGLVGIGAERRGVRGRTHRGVRVHRAVRGREAQTEVRGRSHDP